jgi:hypothetical protein
MAGNMWSSRLFWSQPRSRCSDRSGRGWLIRKISLPRTLKTWPLTSAESLPARKTVSGAILSTDIDCSQRLFRSSSSLLRTGTPATSRLQADGAMQLDRTL